MRMRRNFFLWLGICLMTSCTSRPSSPAPAAPADPLDAKIAQFAPVDITADTSSLPENERRLIETHPNDVGLLRSFIEKMFEGKGSGPFLRELMRRIDALVDVKISSDTPAEKRASP